jgi:hypothetical protein
MLLLLLLLLLRWQLPYHDAASWPVGVYQHMVGWLIPKQWQQVAVDAR